MNAGAGLCREDTVRFVVERGPDAIAALRKNGVEFDPPRTPDSPGAGEFDLTREGGHTQRRILHKADTTGREIERSLLARVRAHPRIALLELSLIHI